MHNHNKNNSESGQNSKMMWAMMIFCALPFLFILFFGAGIKTAGLSGWLVFLLIIIFIGVHFFLMKKMHNNSRVKSDNKNKGGKNSHSGHGCC